jgi:hypothetical protein
MFRDAFQEWEKGKMAAFLSNPKNIQKTTLIVNKINGSRAYCLATSRLASAK